MPNVYISNDTLKAIVDIQATIRKESGINASVSEAIDYLIKKAKE